MRVIKKGKEPKSLTKYKKQKNAYYEGLSREEKSDIRSSLLKEQGYLCAYCMSRISEDKMTIEHYKSQSSINEKEALDYTNMLGVCMGNRGAGSIGKFTCDAHRGNEKLTVNPFDEASIDLIEYDNEGRIYSNNKYIDRDLNETLNLNCEEVLLKLNRKRTLEALKKYLYQLKARGTWKKEFLEKIRKQYELPDENGELYPYSGVILYYLNKRIK